MAFLKLRKITLQQTACLPHSLPYSLVSHQENRTQNGIHQLRNNVDMIPKLEAYVCYWFLNSAPSQQQVLPLFVFTGLFTQCDYNNLQFEF